MRSYFAVLVFMITVPEAAAIISKNTMHLGTETIPLSQSINRVLKEDWKTDRALPPYDRVTMDGIAIKFSAWAKGQRSFPIAGVAAAGSPLQTMNNPQHCLEVMTGSILPNGTDTVIRYEDLIINNGEASITVEAVKEAQNVHFKGQDRKPGEVVVKVNCKISPAEIGVGASIGKAKALVAKLPKVMVISTGDELVEIDQQPLAHQIRRSNVYRLVTTLSNYNIQADSDHLIDDPKAIKTKLKAYLAEYDVVILSGGVSKGKFDYLPEVLSQLGVEKLFHKIHQRPGKPFWFGQYKSQCTVFALPGNPVSSFLCMQRYFLDWLELSLCGSLSPKPKAVLAQDVNFKPNLTYFLEVKLSSDETGRLMAQPIKGNGSGDLANLADADAFIELPQGQDVYQAGGVYEVYRYR